MVLAKYLLEHIGLIILMFNTICFRWIFKICLLLLKDVHLWWSLLPFFNTIFLLFHHLLFNHILPIRRMILLRPSRLSHWHHLWHGTNINFFLSHNIRFYNWQNCRQFLRNQGHPSQTSAHQNAFKIQLPFLILFLKVFHFGEQIS